MYIISMDKLFILYYIRSNFNIFNSSVLYIININILRNVYIILLYYL